MSKFVKLIRKENLTKFNITVDKEFMRLYVKYYSYEKE